MFPSLIALTTALTFLVTFSSVAHSAPTAFANIEARNFFPYSTTKVRGVNLGGWFVLEPWITPSIFADYAQNELAVDENTLCAQLGKKEAHRQLEHHWKTWITKEDFHEIASKGLNLVRIPIGYWSVIPRPGDPYVQGAYEYLAKSLDWAHEAGLKVLIDLHGAPRSQNGFDNSGRRGPIHWGEKGSVHYTERVLEKIRDDHASHPAVVSIGILNEPEAYKIGIGKIQRFYRYMNRQFRGHKISTVIHDAFIGVTSWNDFGNNLKNWVIDTHHYEMFSSDDLAMDTGGHVATACQFGGQMASNNKITIAGEWTAALTDCAKWLNGLGFGARYDGTFSKKGETSYYIGSCDGLSNGTVQGLSEDRKNAMRQFVEAQMDGFEMAGGWIWWTWKTESAPEWDFQALVANGVIPQPLYSRYYGGQCG